MAGTEMPDDGCGTLDTGEVAERLGVSGAYCASLLDRGEIRSAGVGGDRTVLPSDLADYLARRERQRSEALDELAARDAALGLV